MFACFVVTVVAALLYYFVQPSEYTANLQLYVSAPTTQAPELYLSSSQLAQDRVESYGELVRSPRVMQEVITRLQLPLTVSELQQKVTATTTDKSVLVNLAVVDGTAQGAASIADATGEALASTVADLERPLPTATTPPLTVRAVQPTPVPIDPSNLGLKRLLALGLLLGGVLGVSVALLRHALDNTLSSSSELAELAAAPDLGEIAHDNAVNRASIFNGLDEQSTFVEDVKRLRTNIQFLDAGSAHKIFTITSSLPGEGKTTTSVNLAATLASAGHRVLLIDGDLRRPRVADFLGLDGEVGLTSVLARRIALREAIQRVRHGRFDVLASGQLPPNPSELLASSQTRELLGQLRQVYEVILIDTSPLLPVTDAVGLAASTDGAIVVCRAQSTTRAQVRGAVNSLSSVGVDVRGMVLTMAAKTTRGLTSYRSYESGSQVGTPIAATPIGGAEPFSDELTRLVDAEAYRAADRRPSPHPHVGGSSASARGVPSDGRQ